MGFASTFWEAAQTSDSSQASGEDFCQESPLPFTLAVGPHKGKQFASLSRLIMHNYMVTRVKSCSSSCLCFFLCGTRQRDQLIFEIPSTSICKPSNTPNTETHVSLGSADCRDWHSLAKSGTRAAWLHVHVPPAMRSRSRDGGMP